MLAECESNARKQVKVELLGTRDDENFYNSFSAEGPCRCDDGGERMTGFKRSHVQSCTDKKECMTTVNTLIRYP